METKHSLLKGKDFLELLLNSVSESVIAVNLSGEITYWNKAAEKLYKWEAIEVTGKNILEIIPYEISKKLADEIMNSLKEGKSWEGEFEVQGKYGKTLIIHVINSPILSIEGINSGIVISSKEISKQKQSEKLIQENYEEIETQNEELATQNEEIYQANKKLSRLNIKLKSEKEKSQHYLDIAGVMIIALDKNGDVTLANKKASQILEYPEDEIIGKNWFEHFLPANKKNRVEEVLKGIIEGEKEKFKYAKNEIVCKNGKHKIIEWHNTDLKNSKGEIIGILSSGQDITEKIKVEQELNTYINFLDTVMDESPFAMWISDTSGTIIKTNEVLRNTLKLTDEQIIGKYNILKDENLEKQGVMPMVEEVFKKQKPARFTIFWEGLEMEYVEFKTAPSIWIDVSIFPILNNDGEFKNVVCQWVNVTDRVNSVNALKESEQKFRSMFEASNVGFVISNEKGEIFDVNNTFCKILGYTKKEIFNSDPSIFFKKPEAKDFILNKLNKNDSIINRDFELLTKSKKSIWVNINAKSFKIEEKDYIFSIINNITDKKNAEKAILESEERFILAMDATNDGMYDWNLKTNEIYYSPGWKKMLGYKNHELENKFSVWEELTHPDDVKKSWNMLKEHIDGKRERFEMEFRMKHKKGHWVNILSRAIASRNENNEPYRVVGTHVDITQHIKQEEELRQQNEFIQTVLDNLPIGIATNKIDKGKTTYVNLKFQEIYGWPEKDLTSVDEFFLNVFPDTEYREKTKKRVMDDIESGDANQMHWEDLTATRKDGKKRRINAVNIPLPRQNIMVSTVLDITELKQTEDELKKHRDKLEELVKERTKELEEKNIELEEKNNELENMNDLFVGREFRIKELKDKIKELEEKLNQD